MRSFLGSGGVDGAIIAQADRRFWLSVRQSANVRGAAKSVMPSFLTALKVARTGQKEALPRPVCADRSRQNDDYQ
jgi:hypothetical protein